MIRFRLFGIPVEIHPFFWVTTCLLGGGVDAHSPEAIKSVLWFMLAALISILVHELGHALVGLRYGGGSARISLTAFGGLAEHMGAPLSRDHRFRMLAAGPGAGLVLFLGVCGLFCLKFPPADVWAFVANNLFGAALPLRFGGWMDFIRKHPDLMVILCHLLRINFWWSLLNLAPVPPLDGGKIAELFIHPRSKVHRVAVGVAIGLALVAFLKFGQTYTAFLFGYLAWDNYQKLRGESWR